MTFPILVCNLSHFISQELLYLLGAVRGQSGRGPRTGENKEMAKKSIFEQIFKEMQNIHFRLDDLETSVSGWTPQPLEISESKLISLPDHLRKTYMTVAAKGECSSTIVSNQTGRCRAIESNYLNQLSRMGWLNKRRVSKATHFRVVSSVTKKKIRGFTTKTRSMNMIKSY